MVENWGDDVPEGKVTDFHCSAQKKDGDAVLLSWIERPSKKARDEAWPKLMADPRMQTNKDNMPFDGKRMIYGGFATILDARNRKPCNPSTSHFAKGCPSCFRYVPLAMSQALVLIARLARGVGVGISGS
jgi:hypothetical protein